MVSLCWLVGLTVLGLLAPLIVPFSPTAQDVDNTLLAPDSSTCSAPTISGGTCSAGCCTARRWRFTRVCSQLASLSCVGVPQAWSPVFLAAGPTVQSAG